MYIEVTEKHIYSNSHRVRETSDYAGWTNVQKTCAECSQPTVHAVWFKGIKTASHSYPWNTSNLSKQPESGSFIEGANGKLSDWGAASVELIISVRREHLLCRGSVVSEMCGHFRDCQSGTRWETWRWVIVLLAVQKAPAAGCSDLTTACGAYWPVGAHLILKESWVWPCCMSAALVFLPSKWGHAYYVSIKT